MEFGGDLDPFGVGWQLEVRRLRVAADAVVKAFFGQHELHVLPEELLQAAVHQLAAHRHAAQVEAGLPGCTSHLLISPRAGHRRGGVLFTQDAVGPQLTKQGTHRVLVHGRYHVHERLVGRHSEQAVAALVGQDAAFTEDAINLVLQGVLQPPPGRVLFGFVGVSSRL